MQKLALAKGDGSIIRLKQTTSPTGESKFWYILYYVNGRQVRENTKKTQWKDAYDILMQRRADSDRGVTPASNFKKLRYENLRDLLIADYQTKGKILYQRKDGALMFPGREHLDTFFKDCPVAQITTNKIRDYIAWSQKLKLEDPTTRRHLVCLRAAINLAVKERLILQTPYFPMPKDSEPAGKYIEPETFAKLLQNMPEASQMFFKFLYYTGCRVGAACKITWDMVNTDATEIKLPAAIVKARTPLTIVLAGKGLEPVATILRTSFRKQGQSVFHFTNVRKIWYKACHAVGLGVYQPKTCKFDGVRIHDLRCSAAINLLDAGVPQDIVMKIGGWKTVAMFSRYNVVNTERLRNAMIRGGDYVARTAR